ncbi:MAG: peptidase M14, partial [Acidobacteriota bacterium]|nr:peptidase M14 [Acidobacteriota bacterium]
MLKRLLSLLLFVAGCCFPAPPPTPEQFAGFRMGADKKLLRWDKIVDYMKVVAAASPRVRVEEVGKTTMGNPWISVIVSSPETLGHLAQYRNNQKRLAYPRALDEAEAEKVMAANKAVLLITCNIHSSEIGSSQMVLELVYRLATEDSPFVRNILDNVILVLVPSFNPDGQ